MVGIKGVASDEQDLVIGGVEKHGGTVKVVFQSVIGYRVLDERDLLEFWNASGWEKDAWMYRVESGGWLALEQTKQYFSSAALCPALGEYLVAGDSFCVSVLTDRDPVILPLARDGRSDG